MSLEELEVIEEELEEFKTELFTSKSESSDKSI